MTIEKVGGSLLKIFLLRDRIVPYLHFIIKKNIKFIFRKWLGVFHHENMFFIVWSSLVLSFKVSIVLISHIFYISYVPLFSYSLWKKAEVSCQTGSGSNDSFSLSCSYFKQTTKYFVTKRLLVQNTEFLHNLQNMTKNANRHVHHFSLSAFLDFIWIRFLMKIAMRKL